MSITASTVVRNSKATYATYGGQAAMTIDMTGYDDDVLLHIDNSTNDVEGMTATISVLAGDVGIQNILGTATLTVAGGAQAIAGPFDTMRFKTTAGTIRLTVAVANSGTVSSAKLGVIKF